MNEENLSIFKLFLAADLTTSKLFKLLGKFGKAENVFKASVKDLVNFGGLSEKAAESVIAINASGHAEKELALARSNNIDILLFNEEDYPESLKNYADMPVALYVKGKILDRDLNSLSVVGSRKCTNYGKTAAADFVGFFVKKGITVVSGLARGIDTEAHIAAIQNGGRTIAVLGNGLLVNYPPENRILQARIPEKGAVISEYPLTKHPDKTTFPRRNRIISAFSKATLVIEAALQSGALITARYSAEIGKDVFVVPGSIYSEMSKGSNSIIRDGATLVLDAQDMAELTPYFNISPLQQGNAEKQETDSLSEDEKRVLELISEKDEGIHTDEIAEKLNIEISAIAAIILKLEISGLIRSMPGQIYTRVR